MNTKTDDFTIVEATIASIHEAMRAGRLTCRQLTEAYLNRIAAYDQQGYDPQCRYLCQS